MDSKEIPLHFKGKEALEHVIEARIKGKAAASEIHGTEVPGHINAATDTAKETAFIFLLLTLLHPGGEPWIYLSFFIGYLFWKTGRSAILGWSRLERLHRLIEEERWEIEHHRAQEKEELKALYAAKGFSGKLLDEAIDVLMADDNRLLQVMLEEELGLSLESYEHPLKQAAGAFFGVFGSAFLLSLGLFFLPHWGVLLMSALIIALAAGITARLEKNKPLPSIIWNLSIAALAGGAAHLVSMIL